MGIAAIIGAVGSIVQGISAYQAGQYQAALATMNAKIATENAARAIERSRVEQATQDDITAGLLGEQVAIQGASGVSLGSKSFSLTRKSAARLGRLDALNIVQAGELEAHAFKTDAFNFLASASAAKASGFNSLVAGFLGATGSIIGKAKVGGKTASLLT